MNHEWQISPPLVTYVIKDALTADEFTCLPVAQQILQLGHEALKSKAARFDDLDENGRLNYHHHNIGHYQGALALLRLVQTDVSAWELFQTPNKERREQFESWLNRRPDHLAVVLEDELVKPNIDLEGAVWMTQYLKAAYQILLPLRHQLVKQ